MIIKQNRNHFLYIIKNIIKFITSLWFLLPLIISKGFQKSIILGILAVIVLATIFIILDWYKTKFYIKDEMLIFEDGVISKSKEEIPFDKISTVDFGQSILERIFDVCTLKIDTGSVTAEKSELNIIVKTEIGKKIKESILNFNECKTKKNQQNLEDEFSENLKSKDELVSEKVITKKEILKYAFTESKLLWAIGGFFAVINFAQDIEDCVNIKFFKSIGQYLNLNLIKSKTSIIIILSFIVFMMFVYMLIVISSIIFEMIRLNDFTVKLYNDKINISYGLFNKKQYSFKLNKICGIKYKQSLLQQLMNITTVELIVIGYGDEKKEKALLYPIVQNKFRDKFIKKILPEMIFNGEVINPPKSSLRRFILNDILICTIIVSLGYIFLKNIAVNIKLAMVIISIIIAIVHGYLNYRNAYLGINNKLLIACSGSFKRVTTIIREDIIQSITKNQSIFQRLGRVCTYKVDLYSSKLGDMIKVKYMQESIYDKILENLKI